jgi:hypothetical protein
MAEKGKGKGATITTTTTLPDLGNEFQQDITGGGDVTGGSNPAATGNTGAGVTATGETPVQGDAPVDQPSTVTPAKNTPAPGSGIWPVLPQDLSDWDYGSSITKNPAVPGGKGKGEKESALTRTSDLSKIIYVLATNGDEHSVNQAALNDVYKQAGEERPHTGISAGMDRLSAALLRGGPFQGAVKDTPAFLLAQRTKVYQVAWKDYVKHLSQVTGVPSNYQKPPPIGKAVTALKQMGNLPVSPALQNELKTVGFQDAGRVGYTLGDMIKDHDEFMKGAPGSTGTPASETTVKQSGEDYYNDMMNSYNSGTSQAKSWVTDLQAMGYLSMGSTQPTDAEVGGAAQTLLTDAKNANLSPAAYIAQNLGAEKAAGIPEPGSTEIDNFITHLVAQVGVPLSQSQIQSISNAVTTGGGVDSSAGEDTALQYVTGYANANLEAQVKAGNAPTTYSGWASIAAENIRTAYAQEGMPLTDAQVAGLVQQTMSSAPTSAYTTGDQATTLAQQQARGAAMTAYPALAAQINQNTSVATLAAPYLSTAQNLLGIGSQDMSITDPKWMSWATGGQGGAIKTPQEWATQIMSDPQYGYQTSAPAKAASAAAANGLLGLMGIVPQQGLGSGASLETAAQPGGS